MSAPNFTDETAQNVKIKPNEKDTKWPAKKRLKCWLSWMGGRNQ